jgi:hypothetical protein
MQPLSNVKYSEIQKTNTYPDGLFFLEKKILENEMTKKTIWACVFLFTAWDLGVWNSPCYWQ